MRGFVLGAVLGGVLGVSALMAVGCGDTGTGDTGTTGGSSGPDGGEIVILDGGGEPATPPDGKSKCPAGLCNYQTGEGCSGAQSACIPALDGMGGVAPACNVAGAGKSGSACAQVTDCAAGYVCAEATCHKLCCGGDWTGCPSAGEHCIENLVYGDGKGGTIATSAMLCYPVNTCSALTPSTGCAAGKACVLVDATGATACLTPGNGGSGEACPCKGGFTCVVGESGAQCRRLCKAVAGGGEPYCQGTEGSCVHFNRDPAGVGECTP
jgi:hypothetical protein